MPYAIYGAFIFTVALLVTTAYFLLGGLPLLVLKHDVPVDARFIRGFFNVYYRAAFWTALGAAAIAGVVSLLRRHLLAAMQALRERIEASDAGAIGRFRRVHAAALSINVVQLVVIVGGLLQLSASMS